MVMPGTIREKILKFFDVFRHPAYHSKLIKKLRESNKKLCDRCVYGHLKGSMNDFKYCCIAYPDKFLKKFPEVKSEEVNILNAKGECVGKATEYFFLETEFQEHDDIQQPKTVKYYLVDAKGIHYLYNFPVKNMFGKYSTDNYEKYAYVPEHGFYPVGKNIALSYKKDTYKFSVVFDKMLYFLYRIKNCNEKALSAVINFNYKFLHTIDSIILCIWFPFLYPRNRFTGLHYNNWKILDKITELRKDAIVHFSVDLETEPYAIDGYLADIEVQKKIDEEYEKMFSGIKHDNQYVYYILDADGNELPVMKTYHNLNYRFVVEDSNNMQRTFVWHEKGRWIDITDETPAFNNDYYRIVINKKLARKADMLEWFHKYVLNAIFSIPTHNELDAMEDGWLRRFGMDMMKELRKQLKKDDYLYKLRITQIKEKFGGLRFYVASATKEVYDIINKYEKLSFGICIDCGKDAKYLTRGWILPYCEDCIQTIGACDYRPIDGCENDDSDVADGCDIDKSDEE